MSFDKNKFPGITPVEELTDISFLDDPGLSDDELSKLLEEHIDTMIAAGRVKQIEQRVWWRLAELCSDFELK